MSIFVTPVEKIQVSLNSDKNNGYIPYVKTYVHL